MPPRNAYWLLALDQQDLPSEHQVNLVARINVALAKLKAEFPKNIAVIYPVDNPLQLLATTKKDGLHVPAEAKIFDP